MNHRRLAVCFCAASLLQLAHAAPEIAQGSLVNRASFARAGALNAGIAQGSVFVINGKGLGPDEPSRQEGFPLSSTLARTSVRITVGQVALDAYPLMVSGNQVVALLPSSTPTGAAAVRVTFRDETSAPEPLTVVRRNVGVFTMNDSGSGPALLHPFNPDQPLSFELRASQPLISLVSPALPGQTVAIWATGLGAVSGEAASPVPGDFNPQVRVYVGGIEATVRYRGRSSCCAGIDQILFDIPSAVQGCYVPVHIVGAGLLTTRENRTIPLEHTVSNTVTIPVAPDGMPCTDPTGLSGAQLTAIQKGGGARIGSVSFVRRAPNVEETTEDTASARFSQFEFARFLMSRGIYGLPANGSCVQYQIGLDELESLDPVRGAMLDAGAALSVSGPNGRREILRNADGTYSAVLGRGNAASSYLVGGSYSLTGAGGADVGPFEADFTAPAGLTWTNKSPSALERTLSPTFQWEGGESAQYVIASAFGRNDLTAFYAVCTEDPSKGTFNIPAYNYAGIVQHTSSAPGIVWIGAGSVTQFEARGLDFGLINVVVGTDAVFIP